MNPDFNHRCRTYKEAKQNFDPAFSYMVFDRRASAGEKEKFSIIYDMLSNLSKTTAETEICRDDTEKEYVLIVKATPGDIDIIVNKFIDQNLQDNFNYCVYSAFDM